MPARVTFVLPYFNERAFLPDTLGSLACQHERDFALVLVDNGSTDGSTAAAREVASRGLDDISIAWLAEPKPGKIHALETGTGAVASEIVGTLDADTIYPDGYVARVLALFDAHPSASAVMALRGHAGRPALNPAVQSRLFPAKCHTGGFGQSFRSAALREAGGFAASIWPWVLEDHEIAARVVQWGPLVYDFAHVCTPSTRRSDRASVDWTPYERLRYKLSPAPSLPAFFHEFLAPRFAARGLRNVNLRQQDWQGDDQA